MKHKKGLFHSKTLNWNISNFLNNLSAIQARLTLDDPETWLALKYVTDYFQTDENIVAALPNYPKFGNVADAIAFCEQNKLSTLDLSSFGNKVTDEELKLIKSLSHIKKLVIQSDIITDEGLAAISSLANLEHLNLSECRQITDKGIAAISSLANLEHLNLSRCEKITDEGLAAIRNLPTLSILTFQSAGKSPIKDLPL